MDLLLQLPTHLGRLPWHMGSLHPFEQALTLLLAFGPFVLLGIVVAVRRRADAGRDESAPPVEAEDASGPQAARPAR